MSDVVARFDEANRFYIRDLARQIAAIRDDELADIIALFAALSVNMAAVNAQIDRAVDQSAKDIGRIYDQTIKDVYADQRYSRALRDTPLSDEAKRSIEQRKAAVVRETGRVMRRLTRANNVSDTYRQAANKGVISLRSGLGNYDGLMRPTLRKIGRVGLQVMGDDLKNHSLESYVENCIEDGIQEITQYANDVISEEVKLDAVEISVHEDPAPDHEPFQGHIFMRGEFNKLQNHEDFTDIDGERFPAQIRAIGELNCRHLAFGFSSKYGVRRYSKRQIRDMEARNRRGCIINGKHYTLYEARQLANRLAAERERQENVQLAAQVAGDTVLGREATEKIKIVEEQLADASKAVENSK